MGEPIIDQDFKDGQGIVFIGMEGEGANAKFNVSDEAKEFLETLESPIAIAAIVGRYRTGKSFLVNRMLLDVVGKGFQVGATVNSCTKGLWIWNKPLKCRQPDGTIVNLLIVDTEGIGSLDADADHDAKIFAMALLLSSYFIYNSVGSIDESALNSLSLVVELTKHIRTRAGSEEPETGETFAQFFPSFLWVIRDFALSLVDEAGGTISSRQYLERSLTPTQGFSEGAEVKNRIRRMLLAFFPDRDCVTLKRPVEDESMLQKLDTVDWGDLRPEFVEQVQALRSKIYSTSPAKQLNGKSLDGHMIGWLAQAYSKSINDGASLNIGDAWGQVSKSRNVKAVKDAADMYSALASECEKNEMPLASKALDERHAEFSTKAHKVMRQNSIGDDLEVYSEDLNEKISKEYATLKEANEKLARSAAGETAAQMYAPLQAGVDGKEFESFKTFEVSRAKLRVELIEAVPETPVKMEVISGFMEGRVSDAGVKIESKKDIESDKVISELKEGIKEAEHALSLEKSEREKEAAEGKLREEHVSKELEETKARESEFKETLEKERVEHRAEVEEISNKLNGEVATLKAKLEESEASSKEELAKVKAELDEMESSLGTKVALLEREKEYSDKRQTELEEGKKELEESLAKERKGAKEAREREEEERKAAAAEKDKISASLKAAQSKLERAEEERAEREESSTAERARLEAEVKKLKESNAKLEGESGAERARLEEEVAGLKKDVAAAEASLKEEKSGRTKAEEGAKTSTAALEAKVAASEKALQEAQEKHEKALQEAQENHDRALSTAQAEIQAASSQGAEGLANLKGAHEAALSSMQQQLDQAKKEAAEAGEREQQAMSSAAAEGGEKEAQTAAALTGLKAQLDDATKQLRDAEAKTAEAGKALEEEKQRCKSLAANHQDASAALMAANAKIETLSKGGGGGGGGAGGDTAQLLERQGRMQAAHNDEIGKLESQLRSLHQDVNVREAVIDKLSRKVEEANAAGFGAGLDDVPELKTIRTQAQQAGSSKGKDSWVVVDGGPAPEKPRQKQEIVWKSAATPDVFTQVAKQTNQTQADVKRHHEAAAVSGNTGVAAAAVGSGEKFSFARLRQAITKRAPAIATTIGGVVNKMDEWADGIEQTLLGAAGAGDGVPMGVVDNIPEGTIVDDKEREAARAALSNVGAGWSPDKRKFAEGQAKIQEFRARQQQQQQQGGGGGGAAGGQ